MGSGDRAQVCPAHQGPRGPVKRQRDQAGQGARVSRPRRQPQGKVRHHTHGELQAESSASQTEKKANEYGLRRLPTIMAASTTMTPESDLAIPPGEFLAEELEARRMTQFDLATRMGRPAQLVSGIVQGHKPSLRRLRSNSRTSLVSPRSSGSVWRRTTGSPLPALPGRRPARAKRSELPNSRSRGCRTLAGCRRAESVASASDCSISTSALRIWIVRFRPRRWRRSARPASPRRAAAPLPPGMRQGEILAAGERVDAPFDVPTFRAVLVETRRLTTMPQDQAAPAIQNLWRDAGVLLLFVPELPGIGVNGCTRWFSDHALVQVNLRWKWADVVWFTLFHEAHTSSGTVARRSTLWGSMTRKKRLPRRLRATVSSLRETGGSSPRPLASSRRPWCERLPKGWEFPRGLSSGDSSTRG